VWTVGGKTSYECAVGVEIGVACGKASTSTGRTPLLTADLQFFLHNQTFWGFYFLQLFCPWCIMMQFQGAK